MVLFIRARQVWSDRQMYGYSVYRADRLRSHLVRWGLVGTAAFTGGAVLYFWGQALPADHPEIPMPDIETQPAPAAELLPMELYIPSLGVHTNIIEAPFVGRQWDISQLDEEVAHLEGTASPGEQNNVVLAGHVTILGAGWGPFQELDSLSAGDRVFVEWGDTLYIYEVSEQRLVTPGDTRPVFPTGDARLTLITCANWDEAVDTYTHRVIVIARLVAVESV